MKHQLLNIVRFIFLFSFSVQSQTETVTATFKYILGDNDTRNDAKRIALLEAKKLCIEKVGTFVEGKISRQTNETIINGKSTLSDVTQQERSAFIGAIIKVDIIEEKFNYVGDNQTLITTVKATVDSRNIIERLMQIKSDDSLRNRVLKQQEDLKDLRNQIVQLQERINKASPEKAFAMREQRAEIFQEIDELDAYRFQIRAITNSAVTKIDIGMTGQDVLKYAGAPRAKSETTFDKMVAWNYGDVWVIGRDNIVIAIVNSKDFLIDDSEREMKKKSIK